MASLKGIKVLDLTHALAGPFSTMLLAELGAEVIKLEPPGGDHFRPSKHGGNFAAFNRNKRGICLDLKKPGSEEVMQRLLCRADLFVQSFTPGTIERMGYGYDTVAAIKPDIIYCSISGFGNSGPYRELRGYDAVIQSMSGIMMATGEAGRPPVRVGPPLIDMGTGMYLVIGILDALRERDRTGEGRRLDFNLLETALSWMSGDMAAYSITGNLPSRQGSALATFSPYQVFEGSDGTVFIGVSNQRIWAKLCTAFGLENLITDPRYADMPARVQRRAELTEIIEKVLATTTVAAVIEKLRAAGVPCAPVSSLADIIDDPHVAARGVLSRHQDPQAGAVMQVRSPLASGSGELQPAPSLGQHTQEVLSEAGFDEAAVERLVSQGIIPSGIE